MHLLSSLRMGINLGLVSGLEIPTVNELFIHTQPAHLQKLRHETLESAERNVALLFERVEGDHFVILGLPLIPLLRHAREAGWLTT